MAKYKYIRGWYNLYDINILYLFISLAAGPIYWFFEYISWSGDIRHLYIVGLDMNWLNGASGFSLSSPKLHQINREWWNIKNGNLARQIQYFIFAPRIFIWYKYFIFIYIIAAGPILYHIYLYPAAQLYIILDIIIFLYLAIPGNFKVFHIE